MKNIGLDNIEEFSVPLEEHPLKWKFEDESGNPPSAEFLDQIIPLSKEAAKFLWNFEGTQRQLGDKFMDSNHYKIREEFSTVALEQKEIEKWLYERGIPFDQKVFWVTQPNWGFVLTWKMIIKFSEELFFGCDELIWDKTLNWALAFDHSDMFYFGKDRVFNSEVHSQETEEVQELIKENLKKNE
jgi:hypothetical protein